MNISKCTCNRWFVIHWLTCPTDPRRIETSSSAIAERQCHRVG